MNILNRILLLAIGNFIKFLELNAMYHPYIGRHLPNYIPPTPHLHMISGPGPSGDGFPELGGDYRNPHIDILYLNRVIHVLLRRKLDGRLEPKRCAFAEGGSGSIPDAEYKKYNDYYVYAIYGQHKNLRVKCVIYVRQANYQDEAEIVGVKLPPKPEKASDTADNPRRLDPDETKWFIACMGLEFMIVQEPDGLMKEVTIRTQKNRVPIPNAIISGVVLTSEVYIGGAYFLVLKKNRQPVGAMLPPFWWTPEARALVMSHHSPAV